jgi:CRISPR/Cas system-associated exonuclease Cas4 (RecB family)
MSEYYRAKRVHRLYDPKSNKPFAISRSKIDLFTTCPRCFYLDARRGVGRPKGYPFNLNTAVDTLLKKEFDIHRAKGTAHPLMSAYKIDAVPFLHEKMNEWRENFKGVRYLHESTNLLVTGAVDDLWKNPQGELIVVDYKATSKSTPITLDAEWQDGYKRQMEIYQWLLRRNEFKVQDTGYFVYCNGKTDREAFDKKLEFDVVVLPYTGNDNWIEKTIVAIKKCLDSDKLPKAAPGCDYCAYRTASAEIEKN